MTDIICYLFFCFFFLLCNNDPVKSFCLNVNGFILCLRTTSKWFSEVMCIYITVTWELCLLCVSDLFYSLIIAGSCAVQYRKCCRSVMENFLFRVVCVCRKCRNVRTSFPIREHSRLDKISWRYGKVLNSGIILQSLQSAWSEFDLIVMLDFENLLKYVS